MAAKIRIATKGSLPNQFPFTKNVLFMGEDVCYIRNFDDIQASTITTVAIMDGFVLDALKIFYTLPCARYTGKKEDTHPPGTISSVRLDGMIRGEPGRFFKHAVIINVWADTKRVSAKLTVNKIQMCGSVSMEMGNFAANAIVRHVNETIEFIRRCRADPVTYTRAYRWLIANTMGNTVYDANGHPCKMTVGTKMGEIDLIEEVEDKTLEWLPMEYVPEEYKYFVSNLIARFDDMKTLGATSEFFYYFPTVIPETISNVLSLKMVGRSMVNCNYDLGFNINRQKLNSLLIENEINADYINVYHPYVRVKMVSEIPDDELVIRRNGPYSEQDFLIYYSGSVMHSGQGGKAMADCYYRLMSIIAQLKPLITAEAISKTIMGSFTPRNNIAVSPNLSPDTRAITGINTGGIQGGKINDDILMKIISLIDNDSKKR